MLDALVLARIQFAANISFHILFPTITIALGWLLLFFKLRYTATGDQRWMDNYFFFVKVFALSFALGVVSGITMSFQFGTNWPGFMEKVGNIAGPLLAYEVMTAFFLEAVFLGIMLFGFRKVSNRVHTLATFLVAFGTTMSAFWIIVLNSWMHTPQGFEMRDGVAHATDWLAIVFNPSMPYRLLHMLLASVLTAAFLIAGLSALRLLWGERQNAILGLKTGVWLAAAAIPMQIFAGDMHGLNTLEHQPAKVAAMEGHWETGPADLVLFGMPNEETRTNDFAIEVPGMASFVLTHTFDGSVQGLNDFVAEDGRVLHPPVAPVFFSFRVMVGVGMLMLVVSWFCAWRLWATRHEGGQLGVWPLRALVAMTFSGWIATLAGWYVTEIGRQPWLVTGVLSTGETAGPVGAPIIFGSLVAYLAVYVGLLTAYLGVLLYLTRKNTPRGDDQQTPEAGHPAAAFVPAE
ncbi:MAG: cytochrome ubiquinol oxidase subunit I [Pseudomonadota bacterium]